MWYYPLLLIAACNIYGCLDAYVPPPACNPADSENVCTVPVYQVLKPDCNSTDRAANAGTEEICDGIDNDCDGQTDARACETACGLGGQVCDENGVWGACNSPYLLPDGQCDGAS